jgi:hypothetical protein
LKYSKYRVKRVFIEQIMVNTCNDDMKNSSTDEKHQQKAKKVKKIEDFGEIRLEKPWFYKAIFSGRLVWCGLVRLVGWLVG